MAKAAQEEGRERSAADLPTAAVAARLLDRLGELSSGLVLLARSERRAALFARVMAGMAPGLEVLTFPAWDCVPYDRASPSHDVMGRRIATLRRLAAGAAEPWVMVTTPEALAQRVPPRATWDGAALTIRRGEALDAEALQDWLQRSGYILDERVDEAGEAAIRGAVIDLFPSGADRPVRIDHADGRVTGIRCYDAATQLSLEEQEALTLLPASELLLPPAGDGEAAPERFAGMEHFLPDYCEPLETILDYAGDAVLALDPGAEEGHGLFWEQVTDSFETRRAVPRQSGGRTAPAPERLYLDPAEWERRLGGVRRLDIDLEGIEQAPRPARAADPRQAFAGLLEVAQEGRRTVVLAAAPRDLAALVRRARRAVGSEPAAVADWNAALAAPAGSLLSLAAEIDAGFLDNRKNIAVLGAAEVLGRRSAAEVEQITARAALGIEAVALRPGDTVVHIDHGLAKLTGIETVAPAGGASADALVLEFGDGAKLLVPAEEAGRVWRYGAAAEAVTLDKLDGTTWPKRRAALEADLTELAGKLVKLTRARQAAKAEPLVPPRREYGRFAAAFPYPETADQARAIEEMEADLASGRPMDRLVCGDVGFGKTEVALRAAAAAVLAGRQVAVVAPTTVLVRQHVGTFRRRFASFGIEVAHLSRLVKAAEARAVKQGLASGATKLVVGTHALAGKGVGFKDLGLLIIDEEQRFGAQEKAKLRALGDNVHLLTLTATPIPRTLETAMLGLKELSIIATPPARRQPVRTFLTAFDPVSVRAALLRERRRGGQSFVVCPRVEDIEPMRERLAALVPELQVVTAHGKMPAEAMDAAMVDFADGIGDVLLATNIIESGLDVPRANTILIWRADRFGLAQLHQLRGRVGRGRVRGTAYLLTDPEAKLGKATEQRLRTLESLDRLGAGFAISGQDLDLRGAGDLLGEEQAGHLKLIGLGLYQHMLGRALRSARGEAAEEEWTPAIRLGLDAAVPEDYVPEPEIRIDLHLRLGRLGPDYDPHDLADEIADRFGPLPDSVANLIALADLRRQARALEVEKLDAGPEALAATFRDGAAVAAARRIDPAEGLEWRGERLVWARPSLSAEQRRTLAAEFLGLIAGGGRRRSHRQEATAAAA